MPKILVFDVETAPIVAYVWGLRDENIGLNQIQSDWRILAFAAKWYGEKKVIYVEAREPADEITLLTRMWTLLDDADMVITQNGERFDSPKLNARFVIHGMKPPSPYRHLDTCKMARKTFGFTSNKLEYLTDKLCTKYKKLQHKKFPGFDLWKECLKGNKAAWAEMKRYNVHDVLSTEELYTKLRAWDSSASSIYGSACFCGSSKFESRGFTYTTNGKFRRYVCKQCGKWSAAKQNLLAKPERAELRKSAGAH